MSCVNPSFVEAFADDYTGLIRYKFSGNGRYLKADSFGSFADLAAGKRICIPVPCRTCLGCRIDYSREWANRMCLEYSLTGKACFITLTYDNDHLPLTDRGIATLHKRDWQLFMKRLRKAFPQKIRFFMCGEYGTRTLRPHYHAILFGVNLTDFTDLEYLKRSEIGSFYYTSDKLTSLWSNGFTMIAECNFRTCAYVSRYTLKKHFGLSRRELAGALPEFTLSSRRPGIGLGPALLDRFSGDFFDIQLSDGVQHISVPRSLIKKFALTNDKLSELKYNRLSDLNSDIMSKLTFSGLSYDQYLRQYYQELRSKIFKLKERL